MLRACFLLLALMAAALPLLVRGTDVRLSGGAATIESNFPAAVDAANAAAAAHSQARGYPTRLLTPLKVSVHTSLAPVISQAGAAFKATDSSFSALYTVGATNEEAKDEFFAGSLKHSQMTDARFQSSLFRHSLFPPRVCCLFVPRCFNLFCQAVTTSL
jgi:hypothetical protein